MIRRIDRVLLRVGNLQGAIGYYRDVLGFKLLRHDARVATFASSEGAGGGEIVLHTDEELPGDAVYYLVDDVRELYKRRAELKVQFAAGPAPSARGYTAAI